MKLERLVIIRDKTRLEQLVERFNSKAQAKFYIESNGGDFELYEREHETFYLSLGEVEKQLQSLIKIKVIDRSFVPTYIFGETDAVAVIGQDGLVANAAKYVGRKPILSINPDPDRYDGVLLQTDWGNFKQVFLNYFNGCSSVKTVTMAKAQLNDGQELLAFNDFFIGASSHVSARYKLSYGDKTELQSSSGVLVSTGAGSTGWLSSVFNMRQNVNAFLGEPASTEAVSLSWDSDQLMFVTREPFRSKTSEISLGCGLIDSTKPLVIESHMATNGVIFSDGVESDFLKFNTGTRVKIKLAQHKAQLLSAN